jgi:nicotinate-nucleotide--dimethylbenzimidazole phosphoribosyltransferase
MAELKLQLESLCDQIGELDAAAMAAARERQLQLTKPAGSLGRLEEIAIQIAGITGNPRPRLPRKAVIVLAADHGVAAEGVSAYPQAVTGQMVRNFLAGGAAINVLARQVGARVVVADFGVAETLDGHPDLVRRSFARGTKNLALGPAMTGEESVAAIRAGAEILAEQVKVGLDVVAVGEMGIGNTTAASAITAAICGMPVADVTGRGTGLDEEGLRRKIEVIERALAINRPDPMDPLDVLARLGGFEIAGLVGVMLAAAARRIPVVVDGFIAGAAALIAVELCPRVRGFLVAAHSSVESGHRAILERLELVPLLGLNLRLGEGSGAAIALPIVDAALALLDEMATFAEAGVATERVVESAKRPSR